MKAEVVLLPRDLKAGQLAGRACAVFDVLRATTTMAAALDAGIKEIRLFGDLDSARQAAASFNGHKLLCGESRCVIPDGFTLGNSPRQFTSDHRGATAFMSTTNGTRALLAATEADIVFTAALVNAAGAGLALRETKRDVTLLCAGTDGALGMEDLLGAGAVIEALGADAIGDPANIARRLFQSCRDDLPRVLRESQGGQNVIIAGLEADIDFAAQLNALNVVGVVSGEPPVVRLQLAR
jgi:2-phosphosulfolactate phosphatase